MNLFQFFKLVSQHFAIILFVPFLMIGLVFYLTMGEEKSYSSNTSIYTGIASGFDVNMDQGVGDRFMIQSVFENILEIMNSAEVKEEVAAKLIAQHLIQDPAKVPIRICSPTSIKEIHNLIPLEVRQELIVAGDFQKTFENINAYLKKDHLNIIYKIVHSKRTIPNYSIKSLNGLEFKRIKTSDLVKINFKSNDPGIALNTIIFFSEAFIKKYRDVKVSETSDIVEYFEEQLTKSQGRLNDLEAQLLAYRSSNNILDYTEQVRAIAQRRQEMEGEIYKEKMSLASSTQTSSYSQNQLDMHLNVLNKNTDILAKKKKIEDLASRVAMTKVFDNKQSKDSLSVLEKQLVELRKDIESDLDAIFEINYSTSGVKAKDLLEKWFENNINVGESKAKLEIFATRQQDYQNLYKTMAPIGSNLTKIEREVAVSEAVYLKILEALNLAKMRHQNIEISTKLKVVDKPLFPTEPDPSQRKLLIIIAFLVGLVFIIGVLIVLDFLNNSIRNPLKFIELTTLPLASAFPYFPKKTGKIYYEQIKSALTNRLISQIEQQSKELGLLTAPQFIFVCSMQQTEGKTFVAQQLAKGLLNRQKKVGFYQPKQEGQTVDPSNSPTEVPLDINYYDIEAELTKAPDIKTMTMKHQDADYIIVELPYIHSHQIPLTTWSCQHHCLLVAKAGRSWGDADKQSLESVTRMTGKAPLMFLNGVKLGFLEEIIGEIPRKRSKLRLFIRQLSRMEFHKAP